MARRCWPGSCCARDRPAHRLPGRHHGRAPDPGDARHQVPDRRRLDLAHPRHAWSPASPNRSSGSATASSGVPVPFLCSDPGGDRWCGLVLTRTAFGISIYMLGSNLEATRYSGVDTRRVLIGIYTALERALLRRRLPDAGPLQLGQRRLRPILPADHDPGRRAGRGRPVRRVRPDLRPDAGADRAAGDLVGLQPARASAST